MKVFFGKEWGINNKKGGLFETWKSHQGVDKGSVHEVEYHEDLFSWKKIWICISQEYHTQCDIEQAKTKKGSRGYLFTLLGDNGTFMTN